MLCHRNNKKRGYKDKFTCTIATVQYLQGQCCWLQPLDFTLGPQQGFPPLDGGGLVQVRTLIWMPPPHETEQGYQGLQGDQPPSTGSIRKYTGKYVQRGLK